MLVMVLELMEDLKRPHSNKQSRSLAVHPGPVQACPCGCVGFLTAWPAKSKKEQSKKREENITCCVWPGIRSPRRTLWPSFLSPKSHEARTNSRGRENNFIFNMKIICNYREIKIKLWYIHTKACSKHQKEIMYIKPWKTWRKYKCILLSEWSLSEKAIYCMMPTMW